jgi:hypothetical protein
VYSDVVITAEAIEYQIENIVINAKISRYEALHTTIALINSFTFIYEISCIEYKEGHLDIISFLLYSFKT